MNVYNNNQMNNSDQILVGKIVAPQGIRGDVRVQTYTAHPNDLQKLVLYSPGIADGAFHFIRQLKPGSSMIVAHIDGTNDRNAAELLRGVELFINRADLPVLPDGEYYHADLIGMRVVRDGLTIGVVDNIQNYGGGDILELDNGDMIAFGRVNVDLQNRVIYINE